LPLVAASFSLGLVAGQAEQLLLETLLSQLRARGLFKARGRQRTDSTHVLAAIRVLNRLELVGETLRHALNSLAVVVPDWLQEIPAVQTLRQVWAEQYTEPPAPLRWRAVDEQAPSAEMIASPYDPDARYSAKRGIAWVGYKVHLTETCDEGQPAVITQVLTTPATILDRVMGPAI
jgi:transposase